MKKRFMVVVFIVALLFLVGCKKAECETDADCQRTGFAGTCVDEDCVYEPVPGVCGNLECEPEAGETQATCEIDCGECQGATGQYLEWMPIQDQCLEGIKNQKPIVMTDEIKAGGDTFRITTNYQEPFNMRKDVFSITITLASQGTYNSNEVIKGVTLTGTTADRRTVTLAEKQLNRPIFPGQDVQEDMIISFPTAEKEGAFSSLLLKVDFGYSVRSGTQLVPRTATLQNRYRAVRSFPWAEPGTPYPCPESCDDNNPGTADACVDGFCTHNPVPNACGNFICDAGFENKCSCPSDCGPCSGPAGAYTTFTCLNQQCVAQLNPGVAVAPQSLFDDRNLNVFHLQNTYSYNQPFDVKKDKLSLQFTLYNKQDDVSDVKITSVRLLEGTNVISTAAKSLSLGNIGSTGTIDLQVPPQEKPEIDKTVTLRIDYDYSKGGEARKAQYTKALGKLTLISTG